MRQDPLAVSPVSFNVILYVVAQNNLNTLHFVSIKPISSLASAITDHASTLSRFNILLASFDSIQFMGFYCEETDSSFNFTNWLLQSPSFEFLTS